MSLNSLKKMIIFSSDRSKKITEQLIADEAIVENRSSSALIERHLLNDLLPKNRNGAAWLEMLYDGSWSISDVLQACFEYLSAGTPKKILYANNLELVAYAQRMEYHSSTIIGKEKEEYYHFVHQFNTLVDKMDMVAEEEGTRQAVNEAKWAHDLYDMAIKNPQWLRLSNLYKLITDNWEQLGDWIVTYRLLGDMAAMGSGWRETAETRYELRQILARVSAEWDD